MPQMIQVDHNGLLPPAGAVDGVNMTYHHIIPRDILCSWWDAMESRRHIGEAKGYIEALIDATYTRLQAGEKEPKPIPAYLTDNDGQYVRPSVLKSVLPKFDNGTWRQDKDGKTWDVFSAIFQWCPGNIHRGPTLRISPGTGGWDANIDDGGNRFELSAKQVLPQNAFDALQTACSAIVAYIEEQDSKKQKPLLNRATSQLMAVVGTTAFCDYDKRKWYMVTFGPNMGRWRLHIS